MTRHNADWVQRDLEHIWHPASQMKDYQSHPPVQLASASGSYLTLTDGRRLIDATSSWWCKLLGHGHPRLKAALHQQAERFEHVMLANTTHDVIVQLSERLAQLTPTLSKSIYASDGACAVEMAMKMSIHARHIQGETGRTRFMSLSGAYHGETCGALSVSDLGLYQTPYKALLVEQPVITGIPYVSGVEDPLWSDCSAVWPAIEAQLIRYADSLTAIVVEPILQGANGMRLYSADCLKRLAQFAKQHGIHLIADEIMTGLGRTGRYLACEHAGVVPDFLCLGKGLTGGWLPLSVTLTSDAIYDLFYDDYEMGKSFLHSHTYSGNALAAAVALACFDVIEEENLIQRASALSANLHALMSTVAKETGLLRSVRTIGAMVAADLTDDLPHKRAGFAVSKAAVAEGVLLRSLGNTVYWTPPLNVTPAVVDELAAGTQAAIISALQSA